MDDRPSETCFFCTSSDLFHRKQTVAGEKLSVCKVCAAYGRAGLDRGTIQKGLGCQHKTACEIERGLQRVGHYRTSRENRSLRHISASLNASAFVLACACPLCILVQVEHDGGVFYGPPVDIFQIDGVSILTDLDLSEPSLSSLRSMPNSVAAVADRKGRNISETARPDLSGLGREVADLEAPWHKVGLASGSMVAHVLGQVDDRARRHFAMVKKYGPGLRDGDHWLRRDGALVPLQPADLAFPMTEADHRALEADRQAAARWQHDKARLDLPSEPWGSG